MKKEKLMLAGIIVLVMMNILQMVIFFFGPLPGRFGHRHGHHRFQENLIQTLQFSEEQQADYQNLIEKHQTEVEGLDLEIRKARAHIFDDTRSEMKNHVDSMCRKVADLHYQLEQAHVRHLQDIRQICVGGQIAAFEKMIQEMPFIKGHRRHGPPKD